MHTKKIYAVLCAAVAAALVAAGCTKKNNAVDAAHNARTSLNWDGEYTGTIPSASGSGINVSLALYAGELYMLTFQYAEEPEEVYTETGAFTWEADGNRIKPNTDFFPNGLFIGEDKAYMLDSDGQRITGFLAEDYILTKGNAEQTP